MKILGQRTSPDSGPQVEAQGGASPAFEASRRHASRGPEDDFFCLRFSVWYPSFDCAVRTRFRTCPGCSHCEQGRFNLKRHAASLARQHRVHRAT